MKYAKKVLEKAVSFVGEIPSVTKIDILEGPPA